MVFGWMGGWVGVGHLGVCGFAKNLWWVGPSHHPPPPPVVKKNSDQYLTHSPPFQVPQAQRW